jgi:YbbR domain-containing protein
MWKRAILNNWFMKLLSLALSATLWIAVSYDEAIVDKGVDAPLEFRNVRRGAEVDCEDGKTVEVFLRGPSSLMREISARDVSVSVDVLNLIEGGNTLTLQPDDVRHPYGLEVVRVSPQRLRITVQNPAGGQ